MGLVIPDFGLLFWMTVSFLILLFLLKKFAWKPLLKMMHDREDSINKALNAAKEAEERMSALNVENEKILKEARAERDRIISEAKATSDKLKASLEEDAKKHADKIIAEARAEIQAEKESATAEITRIAADLSVEIAEKVLRRELADQQSQRNYVEELMKNISLN